MHALLMSNVRTKHANLWSVFLNIGPIFNKHIVTLDFKLKHFTNSSFRIKRSKQNKQIIYFSETPNLGSKLFRIRLL